MIDFNLKRVNELLTFRDLCATDAEYMKELSSLSKIELNSEPLYMLTPCKRILFTTKLRYYSRLLEKEVNRHLNAANKLSDEQNSEELSKYILKLTREAVMTLVHNANSIIVKHDSTGDIWANLCSENPNYDSKNNDNKELIVFCHNVIAELSRCWLEMQDRYAYLIGTDGLYDIDLFYSSTVKRQPTKFFELKQSVKYAEEKNKFKKCRSDCCFLYDNEEFFNVAIQEFTNKLISYNLIDKSVDYLQMEQLFRGRSCRIKIQWLGANHILTWIIRHLCNDNGSTISVWPEGTSPWKIVSCRFLDANGNPMPNIRSESERQKQIKMVEDIIEPLKSWKG